MNGSCGRAVACCTNESLRGASWNYMIRDQRQQLADHLEDNPSLRAVLGDAVGKAWRRALAEAEHETGIRAANFPGICPWAFDLMIDNTFWPDQGAEHE